MVVEHQLVDPVVLFHVEREISLFIVRLEQKRPPDVSLGVRRSLHELPEIVSISRWISNVPATLHDQELGLLAAEVQAVPVENPAMYDEIVAFAVLETSIDGLENAVSLADINQLVRLGIAIEMVVLAVGLDVQHRNVLVEQQRNPVEGRTPAGLHARREKMAVMQSLVVIGLVFYLLHAPNRLYGRWRMNVIEQRRRSVETFVPHQLLGVQSTVGFSERDVALSRDGAECVIVRHRY